MPTEMKHQETKEKAPVPPVAAISPRKGLWRRLGKGCGVPPPHVEPKPLAAMDTSWAAWRFVLGVWPRCGSLGKANGALPAASFFLDTFVSSTPGSTSAGIADRLVNALPRSGEAPLRMELGKSFTSLSVRHSSVHQQSPSPPSARLL